MASKRWWWSRGSDSAPSTRHEPTPYCDRLTLADAFTADRETRSNAEDRTTQHKPVGSYADVVVESVAPPRRSG